MKRTTGILLSWQKPEGGFGGKEREVLYKKTRKHHNGRLMNQLTVHLCPGVPGVRGSHGLPHLECGP